jgi:hypothetical protein
MQPSPIAVATLPPAVFAIAWGVAVAIAAILPTCLYAVVEPRGRLAWARAGDRPEARRAPLLVRCAAWACFAIGQLGLLHLVVPLSCAAILYVQARLGMLQPAGLLATAGFGVLALFQSVYAALAVPMGVRLLVRDRGLLARGPSIAWRRAVTGASLLALVLLAGWGMARDSIHPWLQAVLFWAALRPVQVLSAAILLHAALLGLGVRRAAHSEPPQE